MPCSFQLIRSGTSIGANIREAFSDTNDKSNGILNAIQCFY
ncbi:MAG: four helix bundle protein [Clostridia bacterium]|nr:four helix bundle protein [Clostridia bacterium]